MVDQAYGGPFGGANRPTAAQKVDLVVGVDSASQMEGQVQVQQGGWRASTDGRTLFGQDLVPSRIGTEARGVANRLDRQAGAQVGRPDPNRNQSGTGHPG